jgi:hypothetical protein
MSEYDTLKSYLVGLGFKVDQASYQKMQSAIQSVESKVGGMGKTTGSTSMAFKAGAAAIVTAIAAIVTATIGMMDKVARADLDYKIFAMQMFMNENAAKKLKIATDALGESLDDIAWNPELRERFTELMKLQDRLEKQLGTDFGKRMRSIRDIRFEFTKMKVEMVYGLQELATAIMREFGIPLEHGEDALKKLNEYIISHLPEWSERMAKFIHEVYEGIESFVKPAKEFLEVWERITDKEGGPRSLNPFTKSGVWNIIDEYLMGNKNNTKNNPYGVEKPKTTPSHKTPGSLDKQSMSDWIKKNHAIMMAESGGDPNAINWNKNGTADRGLFQINDINVPNLIKAGIISSKEDLFDADKNRAVAEYLFKQSGFSPWNSSRSKWDTANENAVGDKSTHNTVTVGDVHVHVTEPNASADDIARATSRRMRELSGVFG